MDNQAGLTAFIRAMPKAELHVHLEGSIRPETLLTLAQRNGKTLPAGSVQELRAWYAFTGFPHFAEIYRAIVQCLRSADDIELIAREFLAGQAGQNVLHTEATYTAYWQWLYNGIPFSEQLAAISRSVCGHGRSWASP